METVFSRLHGLGLTNAEFCRRLAGWLEARGERLPNLESWSDELKDEGFAFDRWEFQESQDHLLSLELRSFRGRGGKVEKHSGLMQAHDSQDDTLYFHLTGQGKEAKATLALHWKVTPAELAAGAATYQVELISRIGDEPLLVDTVEHRSIKAGFQKWSKTARDLLDQVGDGEHQVYGRVSVVRGGPSTADLVRDTEDFILTDAPAPLEAAVASRRAIPARTLREAIIAQTIRGGDIDASTVLKGGQIEIHFRDAHYTLDRPPFLGECERLLFNANGLPWCRANVAANGSAEVPTCLADPAESETERRLAKARRRLIESVRARSAGEAEAPFSPLVLDLPAFSDAVLEYARVWTTALRPDDGERMPHVLWRTDTLAVFESDRLLGMFASPFHPLRLLWLTGYEALLEQWLQGLRAARSKETWDETRRALGLLNGHNFPAFLWHPEPGGGRLFEAVEAMGAGWGAFIDVAEPTPQRTLGCLKRAVGAPSSPRASPVEWLTHKLEDYQAIRPTEGHLRIAAVEVGDASIVAEILAQHMRTAGPIAAEDAEDAEEARPSRGIAEIYLLHDTGRGAVETVFDRASQGEGDASSEENPARELLAKAVLGDTLHPSLSWYHVDASEPWPACHLVLLGDIFAGVPRVIEGAEPLAPEMHGLLLATQSRFKPSTQVWSRWVEPCSSSGPDHPALPGFLRAMERLQSAWLTAAAHSIDPQTLGWPGLEVEMAGPASDKLHRAHNCADWVLVLDHHLGVEYYDTPQPSVDDKFARHILDFTGSLGGGAGHAMLVSTAHVPHVRGAVLGHLRELGCELTEQALLNLLYSLRALSGRHLLHTLRGGARRGEALAAAAAHAHLRREGELQAGFVLPAHNHPELFPGEAAPGDVLFTLEKRGRTQEVVLAPVRIGRVVDRLPDASVIEGCLAGLERTRTVLARLLQAPDGDVPLRLLRVLWARMARFYAERAVRHGTLASDDLATVARKLESLLEDCPADLRLGNQRLFFFSPTLEQSAVSEIDSGDGIVQIVTLGPRVWGAFDGPEAAEAAAGQAEAVKDTEASADPSGLEADGEAAIALLGEGIRPSLQAESPNEPGGEQGGPSRVEVVLGTDTGGREVTYSGDLAANPHLLVVGLSGTGKTTALLNIVRQFVDAGIMPFLVDFHGDLSARVAALLGPSETVILDPEEGLRFNPLRLTRLQLARRNGWKENAYAIADVWCAIFPDFGDLQRDALVRHLQDAYREYGFGDGTSSTEAPPFRRFYELLEQSARADRRAEKICARLRAFFDLATFVAGDEFSLEELRRRPCVLRLSSVADEWRQTAIASLFLHKIYKEMFLQGETRDLRQVLLFDEAHRAARLGLVGRLLQEARKFGIPVILASQRVHDFRPEVFEQTGSYLALRVNESDARRLAGTFCSAEVRGLLQSLPPYHGLFRGPDERTFRRVRLAAPELGPSEDRSSK